MADDEKLGVVYGAGQEDYRQAEWLAEKLEGKWRYDHSESCWHHFDGIRWAADKTNEIKYVVSVLAAKYLTGNGVPRVDDEETRKSLVKLLNIAPIDRALESLASLPTYGTSGEDWDTNPYLLGCKNGIVDLRLNKLIEATPEQRITRNTETDFHPIGSPTEFQDVAKHFMKFLIDITSDYDDTADLSLASFLLLWFGSGLFGIQPEQRFLLMTGGGRNGKGALKHAILSAIGQEYGCQPDANMYSRSKFGPARSNEARADFMALRGRRISFLSEPDKGQFNEELLKAHTGGDIITARNLYQKVPVSWAPTHSITFLVNDAPSIEDIGPSMGSRVMVADFRHRYEGANEDKQLYDTLKSEAEGVLSILCWAAQAWYDSWKNKGGGIVIPQRVAEQSKAFIERNDPVAECLRDCFMSRPDASCNGQIAYDTYVDWHTRNGIEKDPMSVVKFATLLEKKGYQKYRTMTGRMWRGLRPLSSMEISSQEVGDD